MAPSTIDLSQSSSSQTSLTTFTLFPRLPIEIRVMIWKLSLPGPRIVHIKQRRLKELEGNWWERVRSDIAMWPCDKPFEQDELARWEKDDWHAKFECEYDGDAMFDDLAEVERLEKESEEQEAARKERLRLPDELKGLHFEMMPEHSEEFHRRVKQGEWQADVLLEMIRDYKFIVVPKDYRKEEGYTFSDSEGDQDEYSNADSQQESEFGDGEYRPKRLWGFSTESPTPALVLACRESRAVALESYRPIFSSLGALPQIYFDSLRDSLFIDHESFLEEYENLPSLAAKYLLPSDLAEVRELAIEGLGPYEYIGRQEGAFYNSDYERWLFETSLLFPNTTKVNDVCEHLVYGPQSRKGQKYDDLKICNFFEIEKKADGTVLPASNDRAGTFYVNGLHVDRSFIDWDKIIGRHILCWSDEEALHDLWDEWQKQNPDSKRPYIEFNWEDLISAADERLLLHDAAIFEKQHNQGQRVSYMGPNASTLPQDIPAHFFI